MHAVIVVSGDCGCCRHRLLLGIFTTTIGQGAVNDHEHVCREVHCSLLWPFFITPHTKPKLNNCDVKWKTWRCWERFKQATRHRGLIGGKQRHLSTVSTFFCIFWSKSGSEKRLCCPTVVLLDTLLHVNGNWNRKWTRPSWIMLYSLLWWSEQFWLHFSLIFILNIFIFVFALHCSVHSVFVQAMCCVIQRLCRSYITRWCQQSVETATAVVKMLTSD